nr:MAG TPA: hypothetical protein [Caudoviricetes sp.]
MPARFVKIGWANMGRKHWLCSLLWISAQYTL